MRRSGPLLLILLALGAVGVLAFEGALGGWLGGGSGAERPAGDDADDPTGGGAEPSGAPEGGRGPRLLAAERPVRDAAQVAAAEAAAEAARRAAAEAAAKEGQVPFGGVLADASGRGVGGARVLIAGEGGTATVVTDADGAFRTAIAPGRYEILVTAPGRGALHLPEYVIDGLARLDLALALASPAALTLRVERQGRGVEGVAVEARLARWRWEGEAPEAGGATDADGRLVLSDLVQGTYVVSARVPEGLRISHEVKLTQDAEVRLSLPDGVELTGLVTDAATQQPVAGAVVTVVTGSGKGQPQLEARGATGPDGRYRLTVAKGHAFSFRVEAPGYALFPPGAELWRVLASLKPLASGPGPVERDAALRLGGSVRGRVLQVSTQEPVPGVVLRFRPRRTDLPTVTATSDAEGRYTAPHLDEGEHALSIGTPGWYAPRLISVRVPPLGAEPLTQDVLVAAARTITGVVVLEGGAPVAGARVWLTQGGQLLRAAREAGRPLETFTARSGRFTLIDVPPGGTVVVRAALGALEATPEGVATERPPAEVRLVLARTVTLSGRVVELGSSQGVAQARLRVRPVGPPWGRDALERRCDAEGRFRLEGLIPGEVELRWDRGDYLPAPPRTLALSADDDETRVELVLDPGLVLAGRVTDADGRPIAGAAVRADGTSPDLTGPVRRSGAVGPDGRFRLTGFARGTYRLVASAPGHRPQALAGLAGGEERLHLALPAAPKAP